MTSGVAHLQSRLTRSALPETCNQLPDWFVCESAIGANVRMRMAAAISFTMHDCIAYDTAVENKFSCQVWASALLGGHFSSLRGLTRSDEKTGLRGIMPTQSSISVR